MVLGARRRPAVAVCGSCSPTKRGSAGSTILGRAGSNGIRPQVAYQLIREFTYLYGAVCPKDGACCYVILPAADTECFQIFLNNLAKRFDRHYILLFVDSAPNHCTGDLVIPGNDRLEFLPPYSPELNQQDLWEEIREKIFKNYALKSMENVYDKLQEAALYLERNPKIVQSITAFPYIAKSF